MANKIQLKRSNIQNKVPSTTDVDLGELALNTYDGKLYTKKSDGSTETVVQLSVDSTVVKTTDSGTVTSAMIANGTIVNADVNASAAIAGTKISPDFGSQNVTTTGTSSAASFIPSGSNVPTNGVYLPSANSVGISTNGTGRLFVDADGRILVGTNSARNVGSFAGGFEGLQVAGTTSAARASLSRWDASTADPGITLAKSRGGTVGTNGIVSNSDSIGRLEFTADDGTAFNTAARILAQVDGVPAGPSPGPASMPGRIVFSTTPSGSTTPQERLRIGSDGGVGIGATVTSAYGLRVGKAPDAATYSSIGNVFSANTVTTTACYGTASFIGAAANAGTPYTVPVLQHYRAAQGTINADATVTSQFGFVATNTLTGATNNYGFFGDIPSGAGRFNVYIQGTAPNYFAGNVGIGAASPLSPLHVNASGGAELLLQDSSAGAGTNYVSIKADGTSALRLMASTGTTDKDITFYTDSTTERARIDSSGRLLVGASSAYSITNTHPAAITPNLQLSSTSEAGSTALLTYWANGASGSRTPSLALAKSDGAAGVYTAVASEDKLGEVSFHGADGSAFKMAAAIHAKVDGTPGADDMPGRLVFLTTADGASSPTERMRIDSAGHAIISGSDSDPALNGVDTTISLRADGRISARGTDNFPTMSLARGGTDGAIVRFYKTTTDVGNISVTTTATAYNTSSDYRLKENVTTVTDGITRLQQLKPSRFNFIADPTKTVDGFLAHEVQSVIPEAITGEKDAVDDDGNPVYQGIDQSKLVPLLTAALQEAVAKIESLEARLTAAGL